MAIRKAISKKLRFEIFKRDNFICQYCGAHPPDVILEPDHIHPVCEGGTNSPDNLITACFDCNRGKGGTMLSSIPQSLKEKSAEIKEREAQIAGYREVMQAAIDRLENDMWDVADELYDDGSIKGVRRDWLQSIKMFLGRLDYFDVIESAKIARAAKPFSDRQRFMYFCGICWRKIKE